MATQAEEAWLARAPAAPMSLAAIDAWRKAEAKMRNLEADHWGAALDGGFLDYMDGDQPSSHQDAITTQRVLVRFSLGAPAFDPPESGTVSLRPVDDAVAIAEGEITWARAYRADHKTAWRDLSAGVDERSELILQTVAYTVAGIFHRLEGFRYTSCIDYKLSR